MNANIHFHQSFAGYLLVSPPQEGAVPVNGLKRDREEVKEEVGGALDRGEKEKFL